MRTYLHCVGCEQRHLDAERIRNYMVANGFDITQEPADADIAISVTCAVDRRNEADSVAALHSIMRALSPRARLVVGGCLPSISPAVAATFADATFSPRTMESLDKIIGHSITVPMQSVPDPNRVTSFSESGNSVRQSGIRAEYERAKRGFMVRINHGCLLNCSYCVIRRATGRLRSVDLESVDAAFQRGVKRQEPTIMIVGGDTGAYGLDIGLDFTILLERLLRYDGVHRVYIHDLNANWLLRYLDRVAQVLRAKGQRLRALSVPIQSGSDLVLKRMRRPYRAVDIVGLVHVLRKSAPQLYIGTHIIVGFPGESAGEFQKTVTLLEELQLDFVTCFGYSEHPSCRAATYDSKVPDAEKHRRLLLLRELLGDSARICM